MILNTNAKVYGSLRTNFAINLLFNASYMALAKKMKFEISGAKGQNYQIHWRSFISEKLYGIWNVTKFFIAKLIHAFIA